MSNFNWRAVQAYNGGKEYLAYTIARGQADIDDDTMRRIMKRQVSTFTQRFNQVNAASGKKYTGRQIKSMMDNWVSNGGIIGQNIDAAMKNIANFDSKGIAKSYSTSGDIFVDGVSLANVGAAFSSSVQDCLTHVSSITTAVNEAVNNIIWTLASNYEYLVAARLVDAYYTSGNVPSDLQGIPTDASISAGMVKESETKIVLAMEKVRENLDILASLGDGGSADIQNSFQSATDSIAAAFNSIGGTVHEMAEAHAINVAANEGQQLIMENDEKIKQMVSAADGKFYSNWTAQQITDTIEGKESKEDVHIYWNKGGIVLEFGGNIKLRESAPFQGSGPGSRALGVEGFIAKSMTYQQLAKKLNAFAPGAGQYGYSLVGALGTTVNAMDWYNIKQAAGALSLVDAIAGSGIQGDYSTLLIVNNKIFSIYDILRKIYDNSDTILKYGGNKYYLVEGFDLGTLRSKVMPSQTGDNVFRMALNRNKLAYKVLNNTKISITLNMGRLFTPDIFKS